MPIEPYLLGAWLGDGSSAGSSAQFAAKTDVGWFEAVLPGFRRRSGMNHTVRGLGDLLDEIGLLGKRSWEKFVPEAYLRAPIVDRICLLQGLMDTDGCAGDKSTEYSTSSPHLKDAVIELTQSLGGVARVRERVPVYEYKGEKLDGRLSYRVNVKLPPGMNPFRLPRKADAYDMPTQVPAGSPNGVDRA